jgi:hypothetical protein
MSWLLPVKGAVVQATTRIKRRAGSKDERALIAI